jgi:hypothetical protein
MLEEEAPCDRLPMDHGFIRIFKTLQIFGGPKSGLEAVGNFDLFKDIIDMGLDRMGANTKFMGNLLIFGP